MPRHATSKAASVKSEITAGLVSSAVAIPLSMAFGMFAFVSLGDEYFAYGAMAGIVSAVVAGFVCVLFGDRSVRIYAPRITTTFFLGLLLHSLLEQAPTIDGEPDIEATLVVFFAIILLGGLLQALFGLLRLGSLIKFAPHPVMAGFQNMAAVLLFLVQLGNVLGFDHNVRFTRVFSALGESRPLSLFVAALTFAAMWNASRLSTKVPPLLVGLGCGIVAYCGLVLVGFGDQLGPVIGPLTASAAMHTALVDFSRLAVADPLEHSLPVIISGALALAVIASIDALLCARLAGPDELSAGDNTLLARLGLANAISAGFGGITNGINIGPSLTNRAFGGRSSLSVIVNAVAVLLAATLLFPVLAYIPRAVLSATIMVIAIQHIEPWTWKSVGRLLATGTPQRSAIALDLGISLFVSLISIVINVVLAVFIGILLAVFLFVLRMSRSNIRKTYRCDVVRSRRFRSPAELEILHRQGDSVLAIELQGALFFGTADRLAQFVDAETAGTKALLLDLRRVTEIDSTGARILGDIDASLRARGVKLAIVLSSRTETAARLADVFQRDLFFTDIDRAIEWAEEDLLRQFATGSATELSLGEVPILRNFSEDQIEALRSRLEPMSWPAGHVVFRSGELGSTLYLIIRGRASVHIVHGEGDIRLMTFAPGAVVGELALLDRGPRSATVTVDEDLAGFALSAAAFDALCQQQPDIAIKLLAALGHELSVRIRYANLTIQQLEI